MVKQVITEGGSKAYVSDNFGLADRQHIWRKLYVERDRFDQQSFLQKEAPAGNSLTGTVTGAGHMSRKKEHKRPGIQTTGLLKAVNKEKCESELLDAINIIIG